MADRTIADVPLSTEAPLDSLIVYYDVVAGYQRSIAKSDYLGGIMLNGGIFDTGGFSMVLGGPSSLNGDVDGDVLGGGSIDLGGFDVAVGADGTLVILGAANIFTQNQTINSITTTGNALLVTRNLSSGSTNGPVVHIWDMHSTDDQPALQVTQTGAGHIIAAYDGAVLVYALQNGGNIAHVGEYLITDGPTALDAAYVGLQIAALADRQVGIGQGSGRSVMMGWVYNASAASAYGKLETFAGANPLVLQPTGNNVGIGKFPALSAKLDVAQPSTTAAIPVLQLQQLDISEEFISFLGTDSNLGPIYTAANGAVAGAFAGKIRVRVNGVLYAIALTT